MSFCIISGLTRICAPAEDASKVKKTRPQPPCRAALAAKIAAPVMPVAPPTIATSPNFPLWVSCKRGNILGSKFNSAHGLAEWLQSRSWNQISPQASRPWAVKRPGLSVKRLKVTDALTDVLETTPVSLFKPVGTSTATMGFPHWFINSIQRKHCALNPLCLPIP